MDDRELLRRLHDWFLEAAPEHYAGCGLYFDVNERLAAAPEPLRVGETVSAYDAGLLSDYGGGNVEWWQDYIRAELTRAHEYYMSALIEPSAGGGEAHFGPETPMGELREWSKTRAVKCGTQAENANLAESLKLGWAMCADTFACVIEKIDSMNPVNASPGLPTPDQPKPEVKDV